MKNWFWVGVVFILAAWGSHVSAQMAPRMIISVENTDDHVQAIAVKRYADELKKKLDGRIDVRFFSNARLYRDKDVVQALEQGRIEMAVPGTWNVARFEPNVEIFLLPFFYGRPAGANYKILDSNAGKAINNQIETRLKVKVPGSWIDLGHAHLFGIHQKIARHADIKGLRVRVAGGTANKLRIQAFGGNPMIVPWPDLPEYMEQGRLDAVLTSYETILSAKLWEKGIRYAFEDREFFAQYIPMIRLSFWNKLPPDIQQILTQTWESHVGATRKEAADAQSRAKDIIVKHGVEIVVPEPQEIEKWRTALLAMQQDFVQSMGLDPEIVSQVAAEFEKER